MKKQVFKLVLCLLLPASLAAQKIEYVCGEYAYPAGIDKTPRQAMQEATERAKIDAIGKMFGIAVSEQTFLDKHEENGHLSTTFRSFGGTEVKGEWIKDSIKTEYPPYYDETLKLWMYKVSVCGLAIEVTAAGIDFSAKMLKHINDKHESTDFHNGEDLFLWFRSPVNGYLAVYLIDDSETAYCLLPYRNDPTGKVQIKAGKDYLFFSKEHADRNEKQIVTEYMLTCEKKMEQNRLYIIFSPNEFTKANDVGANNIRPNDNGLILPRELPLADFQKWLVNNRMKDKDMKVDDSKTLTIKK